MEERSSGNEGVVGVDPFGVVVEVLGRFTTDSGDRYFFRLMDNNPSFFGLDKDSMVGLEGSAVSLHDCMDVLRELSDDSGDDNEKWLSLSVSERLGVLDLLRRVVQSGYDRVERNTGAPVKDPLLKEIELALEKEFFASEFGDKQFVFVGESRRLRRSGRSMGDLLSLAEFSFNQNAELLERRYGKRGVGVIGRYVDLSKKLLFGTDGGSEWRFMEQGELSDAELRSLVSEWLSSRVGALEYLLELEPDSDDVHDMVHRLRVAQLVLSGRVKAGSGSDRSEVAHDAVSVAIGEWSALSKKIGFDVKKDRVSGVLGLFKG